MAVKAGAGALKDEKGAFALPYGTCSRMVLVAGRSRELSPT